MRYIEKTGEVVGVTLLGVKERLLITLKVKLNIKH